MKVSKKKITEKILNYVFNKYCDDEELAIYMQDYYKAEKLSAERKNNKTPKNTIKYYKITADVRDFLEPLVDAEYFKGYSYNHNLEPVIYDAMQCLNTKCWNKRIRKRSRS